MIISLLLLVSFCIGDQVLQPCEEDIIGLRLCKINPSYGKTFPSDPPMYLKTVVSLYDVIDFNEEEQTVTVFLQLFTSWNDTRLILKSSDKNVLVQWCHNENQKDPIYEINDTFLIRTLLFCDS